MDDVLFFGVELTHEEIVDHIARGRSSSTLRPAGIRKLAVTMSSFPAGILRIDADRIAAGVTYKFDRSVAEVAIGTRIAEIPRELVRVNLDSFRAGAAGETGSSPIRATPARDNGMNSA